VHRIKQRGSQRNNAWPHWLPSHRYLRFPAGVDSTRFIAAPGLAASDFFGIVAERATSLDFTFATGVDKANTSHYLNYL